MRQSGSALFVSHRLGEVLSLCDEIVVLKDGRRVGSVEPANANEQTLHRLMVGRERDTDYYHEREQQNSSAGETAFAVRNLTGTGNFHTVSFEVRSGEILGIGGLLEAGSLRLVRGLSGLNNQIVARL